MIVFFMLIFFLLIFIVFIIHFLYLYSKLIICRRETADLNIKTGPDSIFNTSYSTLSVSGDLQINRVTRHTSSVNKFALKIYKKLSETNSSNLLISPFGLFTSLSLALNGSCDETLREFLNVLELDKLTVKKIQVAHRKYMDHLNSLETLNTSHKLVYDFYYSDKFKLNQIFTNNLVNYYHRAPEKLDFEANLTLKYINGKMATETGNKITNLLDSLNGNEEILLINAAYFDSNWSFDLNELDTKHRQFFIDKIQPIMVPQMSPVDHIDVLIKLHPFGLKANVCHLDYVSSTYTMTIILPDQDSDVETILNDLTDDTLDFILDKRSSTNRSVDLRLPKFKIGQTHSLNQILKALGLKSAFDEGANFDKMKTDLSKTPHVSRVVHSTYLELSEKKTNESYPDDVFDDDSKDVFRFYCDRPFIYIIHDVKHCCILFMGTLVNPLKDT